MAVYFLSDVHLRLDRPERGRRLARLVDALGPGDRVIVVGDLCDFWFASRQARGYRSGCEGLRSLRDFRSRGGTLDLLPGNHDAWLGPFFRETLGVGFDSGPSLDLLLDGLRIRAVHGHRIGVTPPWKSWMKGRAFLRAFSAIPSLAADLLSGTLESANEVKRDAINRKHLGTYRRRVDAIAGQVDLVVLGHVHVTHDDRATSPRMVVLGGWHHRSSYLRLDGDGTASLEVIDDGP